MAQRSRLVGATLLPSLFFWGTDSVSTLSSETAFQLSLRRCAQQSRLRVRMQAILPSPYMTYTGIQVLESFTLGCLFQHATLPSLFRGLRAIAGEDKLVCTGDVGTPGEQC